MTYELKKTSKKRNIIYFSHKIEGLIINPGTKDSSNIVVKKMIIVDETLRDRYVKEKFDRKFTALFKLIYEFLSEEGASGDTSMILDEIAKLKSSIMGTYKKHISDKEYRDLLKKIIIIEEEFKNKLTERMYYTTYNELDYENERRKGM